MDAHYKVAIFGSARIQEGDQDYLEIFEISKGLAEIESRIARSQALLAGEFAQRAPAHIVQRERDKLADMQTEQAKLKERLAALA